MWPVLFRVLRQYAPVITLPFAALIGVIGYNLENILSDKYTPYNGKKNFIIISNIFNQKLFVDSIKEKRGDRMLSEDVLKNATSVEKLRYSANVLNTNLSPSLSNDKN